MLTKITLFLISMLVASSAYPIDQLEKKYLVSYGNPHSQINIVEYISFSCHNCVELFQQHFEEIKKKYIDTGHVRWTFHPVPLDLLTVIALHCLEKLDEKEKKIFFESVFEEMDPTELEFSPKLLKAAMEALKKPIPKLLEENYLKETQAFENAFQFIKNNQELNAVPALSLDGELHPSLVPDEEFLEKLELLRISHA